MADDEREDPATKSGELMRKEVPLPLAARTGKERTMHWLLSRISRWPFRNRGYVESLKTAREVIEEQTKLEETIVGHGKTRGKLMDLETILIQDRLQRRSELLEEQRRLSAVVNETMLEGEMVDAKNRLKKREVKIQDMELEMKERRLKKEMDDFNKPPPAPEPAKKTTTRGRAEKQKLREDVLRRYENENTRIEAMKNATAKVKAVLTKAATNELEEELEKIETMPS